MATAYIAYLTDMKGEVFLSPYKIYNELPQVTKEIILVYTSLNIIVTSDTYSILSNKYSIDIYISTSKKPCW